MKELNQKEMEQVAGAGWKEFAKGLLGVFEKVGESIVDGLEEAGIVSKEKGEHIKGTMKKGEAFADSVIDNV
ncbi:hypothetical protein J8V57_03475 [Xenorhabdus sp. PB61.4]|uniref:hypothetical protein n=1 Tax=Xenorhabdus sp. PB61.4 TaxID=2788940 RepID=UPI001E3CEDB7|nr:hypothetical protein [Xenorhabdus sp. PB61.4]MCC8365346.1 hypothetical protein [Xenorhabdus sp. PB61.4]